LKFGDLVMAVASLAVIMVLIAFPIEMLVVPALGVDWGPNVSSAVSILLSALIGGYIFAGKIGEARIEATSKITVLSAVLFIFYLINLPSLAHWNPAVREVYEAANPGTTLSTFEWYVVEAMALGQAMFINTVMVLVLGFIGLYVGSMLRQPAKS